MNSSAPENETEESFYYLRDHPDFTTSTDVFVLARSTFAQLVSGPDPVSVDGRQVPGLPPRVVPLDELGTLLLAADCTQITRDAAWAYLITRARGEHRTNTWTVACVGLALPVLLRARAAVARHAREPHDLNAAVLVGFLQGLRQTDLARPAILAHLYWAAYREGRRALRKQAHLPEPVDEVEEVEERELVSPPPEGHPDLVLAAAVADGAITAAEAELISETRLGGRSLTQAAQVRGHSYKATCKTRERAEARVVAYLTQPGQAGPDAPPHRLPNAVAAARARRRAATRPTRSTTELSHGSGSRNVTGAQSVSVKKGRRTVSPNGPKSRIASCGSSQPADRRPRADRPASGSVAQPVREVRSCD